MAAPLFSCPVPVEPHDWKCSACHEEYNTDIDDKESLPWHAAHDSVHSGELACAGCIRSRFQDALDSGIVWPARWVTTFLNPQHYRHILGDELYAAYKAKEHAKASEPPPDTPPIPDGLTHGVEVQICPNSGCKKLIGLRDGCNHVICEACTQNFCFICGNEAFDGSGHWSAPKCPRFGPRGARNPVHDPQPNQQEDDVFVTETHAMHWNVAMQTSNLETQNILRRFVDNSGPDITEEHRAVATAALGTFHTLHGVPEANRHARRATTIRTTYDSQFLEMLLLVRNNPILRFEDPPADAPPAIAPPADVPPDTHIFANAGSFRHLLTGPVAEVFDMSAPETRDDAYSWIGSRLQHEPLSGLLGIMARENTAILANITPLALPRVMSAFDIMNNRFHSVMFTPTSVLLTFLGDGFGPVHALVNGVNPIFGTTRHFADQPEEFRDVLDRHVWNHPRSGV